MSTVLSTQAQTATNKSTANLKSNLKSTPKCYQADQQVKYLHLQAEIEVLLQQLQALSPQRPNI